MWYLLLIFGQVWLAYTSPTYDTTTCYRCFSTGHPHCTSSDFTTPFCCDQSNQTLMHQCMAQYAYCSYKLEVPELQQLTCPSLRCPENELIVHDKYLE